MATQALLLSKKKKKKREKKKGKETKKKGKQNTKGLDLRGSRLPWAPHAILNFQKKVRKVKTGSPNKFAQLPCATRHVPQPEQTEVLQRNGTGAPCHMPQLYPLF